MDDSIARGDSLPTVLHTAVVDVAGYRLTVHNLSNGQRVIEHDEESRRMFADLGLTLDLPCANAAQPDAAPNQPIVTSDDVLRFVTEHPGSDAESVAQHFGIGIWESDELVEALLNRGLLDFHNDK